MRWWPRKNRDEDLARELQCDLQLEEEEQRERGLSPEDARFAAVRDGLRPVARSVRPRRGLMPSLLRRGHELVHPGNGSCLLAGSFLSRLLDRASCKRVGGRRETSRCVARTADVSGMCPHV